MGILSAFVCFYLVSYYFPSLWHGFHFVRFFFVLFGTYSFYINPYFFIFV